MKLIKYLLEKEGASLPYLKQLEKSLNASIPNLRASINLSGEEVSNQELKLMRKVREQITYMYNLVEGKEDATGKRRI